MTDEELIARIKTLYGEPIPYSDEQISAYLAMATDEIIRYTYTLLGMPDELPETSEYDNVKVFAVLEGLTHNGAEGVVTQTEGSFRREFKNEDMIGYIHNHVVPFVGIGR